MIEQLIQLSPSSLGVSWAQPSPSTTAQILYYEANGVISTVNISNGVTINYVLNGLRSGWTYSISLQALSPHLPSIITSPTTTTLGETQCILHSNMHEFDF